MDHRSKAAAEMGRAKSEAKTAAARENAKKGGRRRTKTETKFYRDGSITYWSVYDQMWHEHVIEIPERELAAMSGPERTRVLRHLTYRYANCFSRTHGLT